jgi:cytochrome c2
MLRKIIIVLALIGSLLAACNSQSTSTRTQVGDSTAGKLLFNQGTINAVPGCIICHSIEAGQVKVGPSLAGIANTAEKRVKGQTGAEYLRASILDPNAYTVQGYPAGIMNQTYKDLLTDSQVNDLVAYLLTLK